MTYPNPSRTSSRKAILTSGLLTSPVWLVMIGVGTRQIWLGHAATGGLVALIGGVTFVLSTRQLARQWRNRSLSTLEPSGELAAEQFDYVIWIAIGVPLVFVALVILIFLTGDMT